MLVYKFHPEAESWEDAERICDSEGGHLASVHTFDQARLVGETTQTDVYVWVGATNNKTAGVWEWASNHTCTAMNTALDTYDFDQG